MVGGFLSPLDSIADMDANPQNADKFAVYTYPGTGTIIHAAHPAVSEGLALTYGANGDYAGHRGEGPRRHGRRGGLG
jgi:hypothetical protein